MGISTAGHLPSITSTSYPALTSHLLSAYNAQRIGNWTVTVRVLRSSLSVGNQNAQDNVGTSIQLQQPPPKARLMYVVQMSEFPDDTFILIEDPQCETRASIRTRHALSVMQAAAAAAATATVIPTNAEPSSSSFDQQPNPQAIETNEVVNEEPQDNAKVEVISDTKEEEDVKMQDENGELPKGDETKDGEQPKTNEDGEVKPPLQDQEDFDGSLFDENAKSSDPISSDPVIQESKQDNQLITNESHQINEMASIPIPTQVETVHSFEKSTRLTLFTASSQYMLLLSRLNLPAPLGAPSMGDGIATAASSGPGAWIPRGTPVLIQGATYDIPSATGYGSGDAEWRVRLGMVQSGGTRSAGAIVENEYLPLLRLSNDRFLVNHLQNIFPNYLTSASSIQPTTNGQSQIGNLTQNSNSATMGIINSVPTPEQWQEVIPASNKAWMESVGIIEEETKKQNKIIKRLPTQQKDRIGWCGKERGRRLAFLYITLLRNQSVI